MLRLCDRENAIRGAFTKLRMINTPTAAMETWTDSKKHH